MSESLPANERTVSQGGLMRCCLLTIAESTDLTEVGSVLSCAFEGGTPTSMIVRDDGVWEWHRPNPS